VWVERTAPTTEEVSRNPLQIGSRIPTRKERRAMF